METKWLSGIGKFGPYVRYKSKFYSLKKGVDDPYTIELERALAVVKEKSESDKKKVLKDFGRYPCTERTIRTISCNGQGKLQASKGN